MTFTVEDLVPLKEALLSGAKSVSVAGRTVTFQDVAQLKKTIAEIEAKIAADAAAEDELPFKPSPNKIRGQFCPNKKLY